MLLLGNHIEGISLRVFELALVMSISIWFPTKTRRFTYLTLIKHPVETKASIINAFVLTGHIVICDIVLRYDLFSHFLRLFDDFGWHFDATLIAAYVGCVVLASPYH